jgi:hypothetical protein
MISFIGKIMKSFKDKIQYYQLWLLLRLRSDFMLHFYDKIENKLKFNVIVRLKFKF